MARAAEPGYWLKAVGHARGPLSEAWLDERPELLHRTGFPRRPRMAVGERLVVYASVGRRADGGRRPARALRLGVAARVRARRGDRRAAEPRSSALAVDGGDRDPAARAGARRGAADRGDRRGGPLDEPAVANPDRPRALRPRRRRPSLCRSLTMRAVVVHEPGGPEVLRVEERP